MRGTGLRLCPGGPSRSLGAVPAAETLQQKRGFAAGSAASDADHDLGRRLGQIDVVQRFPKPETFTFSTSQQFFYTDNVFYTNANPVGSAAYLGSYTASFVPYSLRDWTPRISLQYNMVRYGSAASGDFDNENLAFSSQYVFSDDRAWSWTAAINLSRFTAPHDNDHEFYKEVVYDNQITHVQQLMKDMPLFFIAAYDLAYHQANPADFDRLDNTLSFSLAYYPIPELSIGPCVRPSGRGLFHEHGVPERPLRLQPFRGPRYHLAALQVRGAVGRFHPCERLLEQRGPELRRDHPGAVADRHGEVLGWGNKQCAQDRRPEVDGYHL